jgi:4-amino-4-deoxy-L-arabinose transferase-like glycosyltransferase
MAVSESTDIVESVDNPRQFSLAQLGPITLARGILALCAFFHLWRLDATPGWDPQEGYNLDIAWNLLYGHPHIFALPTAFAQHPPLYYLQLALAIRIFGYSIVAIRVLAGAYALLTCVAIIFVGRRILGWGPAHWAALVFTVAPLMLANTR